ncbi:MAG: PTS sugar transporter subunit IIB [Brevinema sp.]
MKTIKIVTVCGFGIGTSIILKMKVEEAFKDSGLSLDVEASDVTGAPSITCDIYFTSNEIGEQLKPSVQKDVVMITDFMNIKEIKEKGLSILDSLSKG